ncbi:phosphate ABC transporter substrate-binding protein [Paenibacillus senegalensis]|uniref:phosphate ABC transporter substrate-binding protein n=1 Tax=Paenibacillus senegalensis TaxID=1465766 RepID=UPI000289F19C|nr:phosphate ABC transporter substrate-binding protein [Paenibacillus senegalensis]
MLRQIPKLRFVLTAILSIVLLAGCGAAGGNGGGGGGSATPNEGNTQGGAGTEQPPSEEPKTELSGTVTASGSTALLPLVNLAAEEFMDLHQQVTINVTGGGSGTGVKNVADGTSDIGNSDVPAADEFKDQLVEHIVAIAPFALIVNKDVQVDDLTQEQAIAIFAGEITNWSEVGGQDQPIVLIHRQDSSGSRKIIQELVMNGRDFSNEGITQESSQTVAQAVASTAGAIGYVDTPYLNDNIKALKLDGVGFSKETIQDGTYKIYGLERMYTKGEPTGVVKEFLDFIMSDEFQNEKVEELGFLPANLLK